MIHNLLNSPLQFGEELIENPDFTKFKLWGLYFSAHWCPPCRRFTPFLAQFYQRLKSEKNNEKTFEILFVSQDQNEQEFDEYYGQMPWLTVPYKDRIKIQLITSLFKPRQIPMLYIFNKKGDLVSLDGVRELGIHGNDVYDHWLKKNQDNDQNTI